MSRRMIYLCYGEPKSGKTMLTRHLNSDKVHVCELFSSKAFTKKDIRVQVQRALQKFYPQPIKYSNEFKDGVDVVVFETCNIKNKSLAVEVIEEAANNMGCRPGFTVIDFAVKVRGDKNDRNK